MNISNRRIASINGFDELNQRIEPQNDSKRPQNDPKRSKTTAEGGLRAALGGSWALLGRSWQPSWDQPIARSKTRPSKVPKRQSGPEVLARFWSPKRSPKRRQNDPKTSQTNIKTKNASCVYPSWTRFGSVLRRSWAPA